MTAPLWLLPLLATTLAKYVYIEEEKNWYEAHAHCRDEYTDLAPVNDQWDMDRLRELAGDHSKVIWFGLLRNMSDKAKWWWSGGGEVTTFFWDAGQPNPLQNEDYGFMVNYRWHDAPKYMSLHFFCYSVHVVREERTWEEALDHCRGRHKDLVSISSETEMMLIQRELTEGGIPDPVWTGLRFLAGDWLWLDGSTAGFEAWGLGGKPECPAKGLHCGTLVSGRPEWEARDCEERLHFICY